MIKNNKVGEDVETFKNTKTDNIYKQSEIKTEDLYRVVFKQNRSFELFVNNEKLIWNSHGINPIYPEKYINGLPESIINDKDFKVAQKYFSVSKI